MEHGRFSTNLQNFSWVSGKAGRRCLDCYLSSCGLGVGDHDTARASRGKMEHFLGCIIQIQLDFAEVVQRLCIIACSRDHRLRR